MASFGERLKELRKTKFLTQAALAEIMSVDKTTVGKWEQISTLPNQTTLLALADFFDVSIDYLLGRTNDLTPSSELVIPENIEDARVAFYGGVEGLSQKDIEKVQEYIKFLKSQNRD